MHCIDVMTGNSVHKSESFNSVSESLASFDKEVTRPKTLASMGKADGELCRSPGNGSVPVCTVSLCVSCIQPVCICLSYMQQFRAQISYETTKACFSF